MVVPKLSVALSSPEYRFSPYAVNIHAFFEPFINCEERPLILD